ncbi:unnamed protein product [Linum tenue]|uniref:DUF8040 domain-containing protein n=1 Tax=Linum tenue TaxID=586396 RepID=A0AAV0R1X0_9ROSI|nr:unnamed protein product [Linum tenue]
MINKNSSVEEQVAIFLYTLAHNARNRVVNFFFRWSGETISHHFHGVLKAILSLEAEFLVQPNGSIALQRYWIVKAGFIHTLRIVLVLLMEPTFVLKFHKKKHQDIGVGKESPQ